MLDVHPAHHVASTWKDFFIHIATIVIASASPVGLEQTVELFHRHHQIHQMEADLYDEDLENQTVVQRKLQAID